jgi:hypothetical protein
MAAASGGPRRLIAREEDGARLWFGEVLQSWFEAVGCVWRQGSWQFGGWEERFWGAGEWRKEAEFLGEKKADCARRLEMCRSRSGSIVFEKFGLVTDFFRCASSQSSSWNWH